ncbi:tetratricopeptide repeat protein [Candidatus Omnitrophota bacterium]
MHVNTTRLYKFLIAIFFIWLIAVTLSPVRDGDIWFSLKSGEMMVQTRTVIDADIFSFTHEGMPWINRLWLFQVLCYLVFQLFSWNGLIIFKSVVIVLAFHVLLKPYYKDKNLPFILIAALLGALLINFRMRVRPEMMSFLFLAINFYCLQEFRIKGKWRMLILLPFLKLLWVNMHGLYILGFLLDGACLVEMGVMACITKGEHRDNFKQKTIFLSTAIIASIGALFCNPFGLKGITVPFEQWDMLSKNSFFLNVQELIPTIAYFTDKGISFPIFCGLVLCGAVIIMMLLRIIKVKLFPFFPFITLLVFSYVSFKANRNLALLSIVLVALSGVFLSAYTFSTRTRHIGSIVCMSIIGILLLLRISVVFGMPNIYENPLGFGASTYLRSPEKVVAALEENNISGRIYSNRMLFCNYYLWKYGPERKVFWDGRLEIYGEQLYEDAISSVRSREEFNRFLSGYSFDCLVFAHRTAYVTDPKENIYKRISELYHSPEWKLIYLDSYYCVFVPSQTGEAVAAVVLPETKDEAEEFITKMNMHVTEGTATERVNEYYLLSRISYMLNNTVLVDYLTDLCIQEDPNNLYAITLSAQREYTRGNYETAFILLKRVFPRNSRLLLLTANTATKLQRYDDSIRYIKKFTKRHSYHSAAYLLLADNYYELKKFDEARDALETVLIHEPDNQGALKNYIALVRQNQQSKE